MCKKGQLDGVSEELPIQFYRLKVVEKTRQNADRIIKLISSSFSFQDYATSFKWIKAGSVIAIGDPKSAPKSPKNLSMSDAKAIPSTPANKMTINLENLMPIS